LGAKEDGAHNPKGASTAENGAARTTKSVRTTAEHDRNSASPTNPDTPHESKWALKKKGAHNPKGASNPKHGAARTTKSVRATEEHDPKGVSPTNPDTPHESKWALKKTGRITRRVRQPQKTGRRAQPTACARQGSTT